MKVLKTIALTVDWVLAVALSLGALLFVLAGVFTDALNNLPPDFFAISGWGLSAVTFLSLSLLLINSAVVIDVLGAMFWSEYLNLPSEEGRVSVSVRAVQDALERAVLDLEEVSGARVQLTPPGRPGRPVVIRAYVTLRESVVYHSISRGILNVLEAKFSDIVSTSAPVECNVYWEKIKHDAPRGGGPRGRLPVDNLRPQFPVEDDGQ